MVFIMKYSTESHISYAQLIKCINFSEKNDIIIWGQPALSTIFIFP